MALVLLASSSLHKSRKWEKKDKNLKNDSNKKQKSTFFYLKEEMKISRVS